MRKFFTFLMAMIVLIFLYFLYISKNTDFKYSIKDTYQNKELIEIYNYDTVERYLYIKNGMIKKEILHPDCCIPTIHEGDAFANEIKFDKEDGWLLVNNQKFKIKYK